MQDSSIQDATAVFLEARGKVKRFLIARLGNIEDAEEILQETFLSFEKACASNHRIENPEAYLIRIAGNLAIDRIRQNASRRQREADWVEAQKSSDRLGEVLPSQENQVAARLDIERIAELLEHLSPQVRRAFILHKFEGLSHQAVSEKMGLSKSTIEKHMIKALRYLLSNME